jgi:hypothetical protein
MFSHTECSVILPSGLCAFFLRSVGESPQGFDTSGDVFTAFTVVHTL